MFRSGVIGDPVEHSLSPRLHEAAFAYLGLDGSSERIVNDGRDVPSLRSVVGAFDALSVTFPLKEVLFTLCDEHDDLAKRIGAVNSVRRQGVHLVGRNVDGEGFYRAAVDELDFDARDAGVVVLGAGGAARSVVAALLTHGVGRIDVVMRENRGQLDCFSGDDRVRGVPLSVIAADLIVNATPVSLTGERLARDLFMAEEDAAFIDLSYVPAETSWMSEMRSVSTRVANGKAMLIWQAKLQLDWWFEADIPVSLLREAVEV